MVQQTMRRVFGCAALSLLASTGVAQSTAIRTEVVYENRFDSDASLTDWVMEGPGVATVVNGKLRLASRYAERIQLRRDSLGFESLQGKALTEYVTDMMREDMGEEALQEFMVKDKFMGGHFVLWNKFEFPENYILTCDFQPIYNSDLHMLMFAHLGSNGQGVFDSSLKPRNGLAAQYTKSDLDGYRISYFSPGRESIHLRKSPEQEILAKGSDFTLINPMETHRLKIVKYKNLVVFEVDGKESFRYVEENPSKVLNGGYFAIRLMVAACGDYDNVVVREILEE